MKFTMKERGSIAGIDCKFFDNFNLIFLKNFNCILYSQDHRIKLWHQLMKEIGTIAGIDYEIYYERERIYSRDRLQIF